MALKEDDEPVRLKAITAISSAVRNHQAGLGVITHHFPETTQTLGTIDATDMAAVDALVDLLRNLQKKP